MSRRSRPPGTPYETLEAETLRDLALRVALDGDADPSHARAARERLASKPVVADPHRVTIDELRTWINLGRKLQGLPELP